MGLSNQLLNLAAPFLTATLMIVAVQPQDVSAQVGNSSSFRAPRGEFPKTDFDNVSVDFSEILSGGPPRDGIPAIDNPMFISNTEAAEWLALNEPVVSLRVGNTAKAYPLQILIYHEIVNDKIDGRPVAVTFCPLCNASLVFDATVDDEVLDFGTTGRLRKSDLVMYDRQTESWWQQFTGTGIVGDYNGTQLEIIPSQIVSFDVFQTEFPDGKVLSKNTGISRPYGNNPYRGYDNIDSTPFLFSDPLDPRLPPMERVLAVASDDNKTMWQLVPLSVLNSNPVIQLDDVVVIATSKATSALDETDIKSSRLVPAAAAFTSSVDGEPVSLSLNDEGVLIDKESGSQWSPLGAALDGPRKGQRLVQVDHGVHFAFAWLAFDPEARIVKEP